MAWCFEPPTGGATSGPLPAYRRPGEDPLGWRLMAHYAATPRGLWVLKINGVYGTYDYPVDTLINSATEVYRGGTVNPVNDAVRAALVAAGYTVGRCDDDMGRPDYFDGYSDTY